MEIVFTKRFLKAFAKSPQEIKSKCMERLHIFKEDKFHSTLSNHALTGKYSGYRSLNITADWRVVFKENGDVVELFGIGTHSQLYK